MSDVKIAGLTVDEQKIARKLAEVKQIVITDGVIKDFEVQADKFTIAEGLRNPGVGRTSFRHWINLCVKQGVYPECRWHPDPSSETYTTLSLIRPFIEFVEETGLAHKLVNGPVWFRDDIYPERLAFLLDVVTVKQLVKIEGVGKGKVQDLCDLLVKRGAVTQEVVDHFLRPPKPEPLEEQVIRTNAVATNLSDDELKALEEYRRTHKISTRSEALRRLCMQGISSIRANKKDS